MSGVRVIRAGEDGDGRDVDALLDAARHASGHDALGDEVLRDLATPDPLSAGFFARDTRDGRDGGRALGYLRVARGDNPESPHWAVGLVLAPDAARDGTRNVVAPLVAAAEDHVRDAGGGTLILWLFDPLDEVHEAVLAAGLAHRRDLYQMRVPLPLAETAEWPDGVSVRTFEPGRDEEAWVAVNNRAFAGHPEQGGWTVATLRRRMAEPWFDPSLFLLATDDAGLLGFDWLRVHEATEHDPALGEIFVIGVDPRGQGRGLGRPLAVEGLARVAARGIGTGMLYVAAENSAAVGLYRSLGFAVARTDRAYQHVVGAPG